MNIFVPCNAPLKQEDMDHAVWARMRSRGHRVDVCGLDRSVYGNCYSELALPLLPQAPDAIISMGIGAMEPTITAAMAWPKARLYCYCWDCYSWAIDGLHHHGSLPYAEYGTLLAERAHEVWVPSHCTGARCTEFWRVPPIKIVRILSACPWWDHPNVRDGGYAINCLRVQPDAKWGMFEDCCKELGIPFVSTQHRVSEAEYRDYVAGCRFICAPLDELSTGGLSLMEAYRLGKPVLLSNSPYNGGRDYFGNRAIYFKHDDERDFKFWLKQMIDHPIAQPDEDDLYDRKLYIEANFSNERFADDMIRRLEA